MCLPRGFWEAFFDEKIILEESELDVRTVTMSALLIAIQIVLNKNFDRRSCHFKNRNWFSWNSIDRLPDRVRGLAA